MGPRRPACGPQQRGTPGRCRVITALHCCSVEEALQMSAPHEGQIANAVPSDSPDPAPRVKKSHHTALASAAGSDFYKALTHTVPGDW